MNNAWFVAAIWAGLALIATLLANWLRISRALSEIVVGTVIGLNDGIISQQYSYLVATVIGSAVVPTMIASAFFMPSHLLSDRPLAEVAEALADGAT